MEAVPEQTGGSTLGRSLLVAAAIVAFGFVGSRLLGVLRTIVIANEFGTGDDVGAYFVAFRLPDLIFQVLAGAAIGSAFIPTFARYFTTRTEAEAWQLASRVLNLIALLTAGLAIIAFITAPWVVPLLAPGLGDNPAEEEQLEELAVELTRIMTLSPLLFSISGLFTGIPAMIVGRNAKREIAASGGQLGGEGVANAGFITGHVMYIDGGRTLV